MNQIDFTAFVAAASKRAVAGGGRIGNLVLTQTTDNLEPKLREPEMRHALAQVAELAAGPVCYGIEVPTKEGYRFTREPGEKLTSARHDFALLREARHDAPRANLLELKKDQPELVVGEHGADCPKVRKDFQKLLLEEAVDGKSMLHICHAADSGTIPGLLAKYNAALKQAIRLSRPAAAQLGLRSLEDDPCWFALFVLVVRQRGRAGGDQPILYNQVVTPFGATGARVEAGEALFRPDLLREVPLPA